MRQCERSVKPGLVLKELRQNSLLKLRLFLIIASGASYGLSIFFLSDEERGLLTSLLFAGYLAVGASFLGKNTYLAHWMKGRFRAQLKIGLAAGQPGLLIGAATMLVGLSLLIAGEEPYVGLTAVGFGVFIALNTLSEVLVSAKSSSETPQKYWEHLVSTAIVLAGFITLIVFSQANALTVFACYVFASLPFLTALISGIRSRTALEESRLTGEQKRKSAVLFADTFSGSMRLRLAGLVIALTAGPEVLGQYVVLWLGFEVLEQLLKIGLLTRIFGDILKSDNENPVSTKEREQTFLAIGIPAGFVMGALSIFLGVEFTAASLGNVLFAGAILLFNSILRGITNIRQSAMRARGDLGKSAVISIVDAALTGVLVALLPIFLGFTGIALGLTLPSILILTLTPKVLAETAVHSTEVDKKHSFVSIIMPAKNAGATIERTIESVRRQDFTKWELIVVDDSSTDDTAEVVQKLASVDTRIRLLSNGKPLGPGVSRIKAINEAQGPIIAFLDADDLWLPSRLSRGLSFMMMREAAWIHSAHRSITPKGNVGMSVSSRDVQSARQLEKRNLITNSTVMIEKRLLPKSFEFRFTGAPDMELWVHVARTGEPCHFDPKADTLYRVSRHSVSGKKFFAARRHWINLSMLDRNYFRRVAKYIYYALGASFVYVKRRIPSLSGRELGKYVATLGSPHHPYPPIEAPRRKL